MPTNPARAPILDGIWQRERLRLRSRDTASMMGRKELVGILLGKLLVAWVWCSGVSRDQVGTTEGLEADLHQSVGKKGFLFSHPAHS